MNSSTLRQQKSRRSIRLRGYSYSEPGYYFVTLCTQDRVPLFGKIIKRKMALSRYGHIAKREWQKTFKIRKEIQPDAFIVMPDHIHVIVRIRHGRRGTPLACPTNPPQTITVQRNKAVKHSMKSQIEAIHLPACPTNPPQTITVQSPNMCPNPPYKIIPPRNILISPDAPLNNNVPPMSGMRLDVGTPAACPYERRFGLSVAHALPTIIGQYKSAVTKHIYAITKQRFLVWQRNYFERIIKNENQLYMTREYIRLNPERYKMD